MKLLKKIFLLCLLFGSLFLTACGIEVSTNMNIEDNFHGKRVISCFVSKQDMASYFKGDLKNMDSMLENNCPDCFVYSKKETTHGTEFIFEIPFQSMEDYETAVSSVLHFSPEIEYSHTDSLFSNGITLKENFTSVDLLRWFEILLNEEYSIKKSQLSSLWDVKDTYVTWKQETYESKTEKIDISYSKQLAFDGIDIFTEETDQRIFERKICFQIPTKTLNTEVLNLKSTFEALKPENATAEWTTNKNGKNYEITFQAESLEDISHTTSQIFMVPEQEVNVSSTFADYHLLHFDLTRMENFDFSHFVCNEQGEVPVRYYYKPNSMTKTKTAEMQKQINNSFEDNRVKNGFYLLYEGNCQTLSVGYLGTMTIPTNSYSIRTTLKDNEKLERSFIFRLHNILTDDEASQLASFFEKNNTSNLNMSMEEKGQLCTLTIYQTGTKDNLNYSSKILFGSENNSVIYKKNASLLSPMQDISVTETIDLSYFLGNVNSEISGEYTFIQETGHTIKNFVIHSDICDVQTKESTAASHRASIRGTSFMTEYMGTSYYMPGILFVIVLFASLGFGLWFLTKRNPMKKKT